MNNFEERKQSFQERVKMQKRCENFNERRKLQQREKERTKELIRAMNKIEDNKER